MIHNIKEFSTLLQESLACSNLIMHPPKYSIYTKVYSSHPHITKGKMTEKNAEGFNMLEPKEEKHFCWI